MWEHICMCPDPCAYTWLNRHPLIIQSSISRFLQFILTLRSFYLGLHLLKWGFGHKCAHRGICTPRFWPQVPVHISSIKGGTVIKFKKNRKICAVKKIWESVLCAFLRFDQILALCKYKSMFTRACECHEASLPIAPLVNGTCFSISCQQNWQAICNQW